MRASENDNTHTPPRQSPSSHATSPSHRFFFRRAREARVRDGRTGRGEGPPRVTRTAGRPRAPWFRRPQRLLRPLLLQPPGRTPGAGLKHQGPRGQLREHSGRKRTLGHRRGTHRQTKTTTTTTTTATTERLISGAHSTLPGSTSSPPLTGSFVTMSSLFCFCASLTPAERIVPCRGPKVNSTAQLGYRIQRVLLKWVSYMGAPVLARHM